MDAITPEALASRYPDMADIIRSMPPNRAVFAYHLAHTRNQTRSYQLAYNEETPENAGPHGNRLAKDGRVKALVERISHEAMARAAEKIEFSKEKIMLDLERGKEQALEINQLGPYMRGCELQGKELGMFVDRSEHIHRVDDTEIIQQLAALNPELARLAGEVLEGEYSEMDGLESCPEGDISVDRRDQNESSD